MKVIKGNCIEVLKTLEENSVDSVVTDPPYEIGFMGKNWDSSGIANNPEMWKECLRVLKPGGYLLSFSATRTYHRMAVGVEDAGFEIRDMIEWVYGSGFPKSHNIGKAVDKLQGNEREVVGNDKSGKTSKAFNLTVEQETQGTGVLAGEYDLTKGTSEYEGWGTALKPAHEPICMARKPLAEKTVAKNCLKWGTGGINIDESRVEGGEREARENNTSWGISRIGEENDIRGNKAIGKTTQGRFPANLIHDNSEEVKACFPETKGGGYQKGSVMKPKKSNSEFLGGLKGKTETTSKLKNDDGTGNASRFFKSIIYQAKPSKKERNAGIETNNHPTVKPIALMEYLINMVTPKGGIVLDPFMGSGTTGCAAVKNGFDFIGIDLEEEYIKIATSRIKHYKKEKESKLF